MKLTTVINKIQKESDINTFLNHIEDGMLKGLSTNLISRGSPVKLSPKVLDELLDMWYPGYSNMSTPQRRQWLLTHWPLLHMEQTVNWKHKLYDPSHPIYKHFTYENIVKYHGQKSSAGKRGISWKFDFLTWIVWWMQTEHFYERGVCDHQYQMCRTGDIGPYSWDNVYCDTGENNKRDFWESIQNEQKEAIS